MPILDPAAPAAQFVKPKLYFRNRLRAAQLGDDGNAYASCSAAVEDEDDPFIVRGDIRPVADISALSTLNGAQALFGTTGNRYQIAGVDSTFNKLDDALFGYPECEYPVDIFLASSGTELVIVSEDTIYVLNSTTLAVNRYARLTLAATAGCLSTDGLYIYIVGGTTVQRLLLSDLSVLNTGTLLAGDWYPLGIVQYGGHVYICAQDADSGALIRFVAADLTRLDSLSFDAGEYLPVRLVIDTAGTYLYVQCSDGADTVIVKVALSPFARTAALTLSAGEAPARGMAINATHLYVAVAIGGNGAVVQVELAGFSRVAVATFPAGHKYPESVVANATHVYSTAMNTTGAVGYIEKITIAGFAHAATLNSTFDMARSLAIDALNLYHVTNQNYLTTNAGAEIVPLSSFTVGSYKSLPVDSYISGTCEDDSYIYVLDCLSMANAAGVWRISKTTRALVDLLELTGVTLIGSDGYGTGAIACGSGYVYVAGAGGVARVATSGFYEVDTVAFAFSGTPVSAFVNAAGTYLYVLDSASPSALHRFTLSPLAFVDTVTFSAGENTANSMAVNATAAYISCYTSPGLIVKVTLSPYARTSAVTIGNSPVSIALSSTHFYALLGGNPATISRGTLSPYAAVDSLALTTDSEQAGSYIGVTGTAAVVACVNASNKLVIVRVNLDTFTRINATTFSDNSLLRYGIIYDGILSICASASMAFVGFTEGLTLLEQLQAADVGAAFTIRAGLTCSQIAESLPMVYAADNHLAPRGTGLTNTEIHIRIHAPNYVQNGSFEIGALTGWTAGANWAVNSANAIEGGYSAAWDTGADNDLVQSITGKIEAGKTYRLLVKAKTLTGNAEAGSIIVALKNAASGTAIDADLEGTSLEITTTATWFTVDFVPDYTTNTWALHFETDSTKNGTATAVLLGEVYLYKPEEVSALLLDRHNWGGRTVTVKAWQLSPLRSTAASDAANSATLGTLAIETTGRYEGALTSSYAPVIEIILPAASGWIAEAGEIYAGDAWELPRYPKNCDPYETNQGRLRSVTLNFDGFAQSLRQTQIADLYAALEAAESVWWKWNTDAPLLMYSPKAGRKAPYERNRISLSVELVEQL